MNILQELHHRVNSVGLTLKQAIAEVSPGADPAYWRRQLDTYNPAAPAPKPKRRYRRRTRRQPSAARVLARQSSAAVQAEKRGRARAEQVERVNGRTAFLTANGETTVIELDEPFWRQELASGETMEIGRDGTVNYT